jgi:DNA (cytosine-5)-methyltransferase 1
MTSVELFAGAGGLAMGVSMAGFKPDAVIEWDKNACDTIRRNQQRGINPVVNWRLFETDVRLFDFSNIPNELDLLAGGPPCQPFSLGGKHRAYNDERDMFPEVIRAIRNTRPRAILIENVKGLVRQAFAKYFEYIILQITYPDVIRKTGENWTDHLSRLERYHTGGCHDGLVYRVVFRLLNAADYGVPQRRERVFIVGFRADLGIKWAFPDPTHSQDALLWQKWVTGEYWERHKVPKKDRPEISSRLKPKISSLGLEALLKKPWLTVRDAIADLPDPKKEDLAQRIPNHRFIPGARIYLGHTGSPLDEPSKTLKAGDHGVPGGENMLVYPDNTVRYFTLRESARLQTFPDNYEFHGSWTETMRQLGNAVPVTLAYIIASDIKARLETAPFRRNNDGPKKEAGSTAAEKRDCLQPLRQGEFGSKRGGGFAFKTC